MKKALVSIILFAVLACRWAWADVPSLINYQGRLLDTLGNPVNGTVTVVVAVCPGPTGGPTNYLETVGSVLVVNGVYSFEFGGANPTGLLAALSQAQAWLQLTLDGAVLSPRQRLVSTPYALLAAKTTGQLTSPQITFDNGAVLQTDGTNLFLVSADRSKTNQVSFASTSGGTSNPPAASGIAINLIRPANGGTPVSFTAQYGAIAGSAANLTDGAYTSDWNDNWFSPYMPQGRYEFVYAFSNGLQAVVSNAVIYNFGQDTANRYSKGFQVLVSTDGTNYVAASTGVLANTTAPQTFGLGNTAARYLKLAITSGYSGEFWQLGEFIVNGWLINDLTPPVVGTPSCVAATNSNPVVVSYTGTSDAGGSGLKRVMLFVKKGTGVWTNTGLSGAGTAGVLSYTGLTASDTYTFTLQAEDNAGNLSAFPGSTCAIVYTAPPNRPPVANADTSSTTLGIAVTVNVLTNDTDADADLLVIASYTQPASGGTVVTNAARTALIFTPTTNGPVTFTYVADDQRGGLATGTVTVTTSTVPATPQYMLVDLSAGPTALSYPISYSNTVPSDLLSNPAYKTTILIMRMITNGTFLMSAPAGEFGQDAWDSDEHQHSVTLTKDYYIGVFELTEAQWQNVMGPSAVGTGGSRLPKASVLWGVIRGTVNNIKIPPSPTSFMGVLSSKLGRACDLPTEARWEYACRAGTLTSLNSGKNLSTISGPDPNCDELAWYMYNAGNMRHEVGLKRPNNWGLYDMHGNVYEFVIDYWAYNVVWWTDTIDPDGIDSADPWNRHIVKGSCFLEGPQNLRQGDRFAVNGDISNDPYGFRVIAEMR